MILITSMCKHTVWNEMYLFTDLPVQTTLRLLVWLLSAEAWLELSLVSGGGVETNNAPTDGTTRGFLYNTKQAYTISLTLSCLQRFKADDILELLLSFHLWGGDTLGNPLANNVPGTKRLHILE